jgi:excisionase family DNA binding protein
MSIESLLTEIRDECRQVRTELHQLRVDLAGRPRLGELLTIEEAAPVLKMSRAKIWQRISSGKFPAYRDGKTVLMDCEEIRHLMRKEQEAWTGASLRAVD